MFISRVCPTLSFNFYFMSLDGEHFLVGSSFYFFLMVVNQLVVILVFS